MKYLQLQRICGKEILVIRIPSEGVFAGPEEGGDLLSSGSVVAPLTHGQYDTLMFRVTVTCVCVVGGEKLMR